MTAHEVDHSALGARIKKLREDAGIKAVDLAATAGVTPVTLWKWESGAMLPNVVALDAIARRLGTTCTYLLWGQHVPPLAGESLHPEFLDFLAVPGISEALERAPWKREQLARMYFPPPATPSVRAYMLALSALDAAESDVTHRGDTGSG